ncbi:hypothetical protein W03_10550 [Nitrosomonas sp. PY1]|uniref:hypothetical protein n=1 Tax=Nitrosomonas sp. PY1 TaxID=1803906 RepID=UPI001FC7E849|nr:hypothetical protein [Nitrosomonas sp. PY1]GKS69051.1 hypothetical protein W03_10550 [Nitrosomonas sp. PY1]
MQKLILIFLLGLILVSWQAKASPILGLCEPQEIQFFHCKTKKGSWANLCGTSSGGLQYRFGRSGKIALRYPENPAEGKEQFLLARYFRFQTNRIEVTFQNQAVSYTIFDYTEGKHRHAGLRVNNKGSESEIPCSAPFVSKLVELESVLDCDPDNALNGGVCR